MSKDSRKNNDPNASVRKMDHIQLAFDSQTEKSEINNHFYYEPALKGHPKTPPQSFEFLDKTFSYPIWISSMTGGTQMAASINTKLAKACKEYGLGMGLGSCRSLLFSNERIKDFDVRKHIGDQALYANLGVAQIEELVRDKQLEVIKGLINKLDADGLIIHINPLQEWLQPEGDRYFISPIDLISDVLNLGVKIIVKEVGQGMGPESLKSLLELPIEALEFGAHGGTNFSKLELLRSDVDKYQNLAPLFQVGHSAEEMVNFTNEILHRSNHISCNQLIISGGIKNFLDGYYLINKSKFNAIYAQASAFLKPALESYEALQSFIETQINGYTAAYQFLSVKR